ncbi:Ubiquitin carboxyl-terminal hydrolase 35 [Chamberlinius hualienensis]
METIFKGIAYSKHSDKMKMAILESSVLQAAKNPEDVQGTVCHKILEAVFEVIGKSNVVINLELGLRVLEEWMNHHGDHMGEFLTPQVFENYLKSAEFSNKSAVLKVSHYILLYELSQTNKRDIDPFIKLLRTCTFDLIKWDTNLNVVVSIIKMWVDLDSRFYEDVNPIVLVKTLINKIAECQYSNDQTQVALLRNNVKTVSNFIGLVWANFGENNFKECLMEIYTILSSWMEKIPSHCLASLVPFIPVGFMEEMAKQLATTYGSHSDKRQFLCRVIDWLCCPFNKNVDAVIFNLMKSFEAIRNYNVLIDVAQIKSEQMFLQLKFTLVREPTLPVLFYILLSYQHSADLFHKIIPHVPAVLKSLKKENTESSLSALSQIVGVMHTLMQFHSGFPEIYDQLLNEIKEFEPPPLDTMKDFMSSQKWIATNVTLLPSTTLIKPAKSVTGKTGLVNLGNTCYVNSVLQALFMNDEFRNSVLTSHSSINKALLTELQRAFAFLSYSQRPAYSANGFFLASIPDWFEPGRQQDCSEFLRHFFDKMHEQECYQEMTATTSSPDAESSGYSRKTLQCENGDLSGKELNKLGSLNTCLIHQLFGGQLRISYECLNCRRVSVQSERFIDLSLALPKCHSDSKYIQRRELKAGRPENLNMTLLDEEPTRAEASLNPDPVSVPIVVGESESEIKVEELIQHYISPEKLEGENRYHCDNCNELQEAEKSISITCAPKYLTLTLLRFAYDIETQQRIKILKNIVYPEVLSIPVSSSCDKQPGDATDNYIPPQLYSLYAVVVHSGLSSDCGHYYTYACHSDLPPDSVANNDNAHSRERSWYLFNDSRVQYSDFKSLSNLTQRFAKDTAYLLFYRKMIPEEEGVKLYPQLDQSKLRKDLCEEVTQDNLKYLQEVEDESNNVKVHVNKRKPDWHDFDDQNPPGGLGGGFDGLGSFSVRFVC